MKTNEIHITFPALSENESVARMCASAFAAQFNPTIEELSDIRTAVSEAVTNAIVHAYNSSPLPVYMDMYKNDDTLKIVIRDTGRGIENVTEAMQPFYTTMPGEERSGMGFSVMEAFMDSLHVKSQSGIGTTVTMTKTIKKDISE